MYPHYFSLSCCLQLFSCNLLAHAAIARQVLYHLSHATDPLYSQKGSVAKVCVPLKVVPHENEELQLHQSQQTLNQMKDGARANRRLSAGPPEGVFSPSGLDHPEFIEVCDGKNLAQAI
jgi:hypothetical protein